MTACSCSYPIHAIECDCGQPAPQTPERIAADKIAAEAARRLCVQMESCDDCPCPGCQHDGAAIGKAAVEAIAAAGLVIVPAARVAAWMGVSDA